MTRTLITQAITLGRELMKLTDCTPRELLEVVPHIMQCNMGVGVDDITVHLGGNDWRFIGSGVIDGILKDELEADPYVLGCFTASCIASNSGIAPELVEIIQGAEAFEKLGQHLIDAGCVESMAEGYAAADGYGHHFAHYDGETHELSAVTYFAFNCG
jgi:hypothetical protein